MQLSSADVVDVPFCRSSYRSERACAPQGGEPVRTALDGGARGPCSRGRPGYPSICILPLCMAPAPPTQWEPSLTHRSHGLVASPGAFSPDSFPWILRLTGCEGALILCANTTRKNSETHLSQELKFSVNLSTEPKHGGLD